MTNRAISWSCSTRANKRGLSLISGLEPVARLQEVAVELRFGRAGGRLPVIAPFGARRQGHEDRLGAAARLQAEERAAIVDQVELDVAAAPVGLEAALALAERQVFPSFEKRYVGLEEMVADRLRQVERGRLRQVVEEDAADAARLVAVAQVEVFVAPALVLRIVIGAERRQRLPARCVEVARVVLEAVVRREVHAAAEPPDRVFPLSGKKPDVEMDRGAIRIARMQDQRDAHGFEGAAGELRACGTGRWRQVAALHAREVHAAALEDLSVLDDAGGPAAALGALPRIAGEALAVDDFQRGDDPLLQRREIVVNDARVQARRSSSARGARCPCGTACRRSGCARAPRRRARAPSSPSRQARLRTAR